MTRMRLYGIGEADIAAAAVEAGAPIRAVETLGLCAVIGPAPDGAPKRPAETARALLHVQETLEALGAAGPILPAAPALRFRDETEVLRFVIANASALRGWLAEYGALRQYQARIAWREAAAQAEAEAAAWRERIAKTLRDVIDLPLDRDVPGEALNLVGLIEGEAALLGALTAIDEAHQDRLRIRLIGPLPAVSFALIEAEEAGAARLEAARSVLGAPAEADPAAIRSAYHQAARRLHPDTGEGDAAALQEAKASADLLARWAEAGAALRRAGAEEGGVALARLRRAGQARAA